MEKYELEYRFYDFNKKEITDIICHQISGENVHPRFLMEFTVFNSPCYLRLRKELDKVFLTSKNHTGKFAIEREVEVSDYNETIQILKMAGIKEKYNFMKIREKWKVKNTEIVFDMYPGLPEYVEIESKTLEELNEICKLLNLDPKNHKWKPLNQIFKETYDIDKPPKDLTFINLEERLKPLIKKNYEIFENLNDIQKEIFILFKS